MAKCVLVMLSPLISLHFIVKVGPIVDPDANPDRMKNFLLVLWYMLPHIVYLVWDVRLGYKLKRKCAGFSLLAGLNPLRWKWTGDRPSKYVDWVPVWLGIDILIIVVLAVLLILSWGVRVGGEGAAEFLLRRNSLVLGFAILSALSMFCDYMWLNRRYYFPR